MSEPMHNRGDSKQDYCTPDDFLEAVKRHFHIAEFDCDLAASHENCVCLPYFTEHDNSIGQNWKIGTGFNWCNPPFDSINKWVQKAEMEWEHSKARTIMLVPAGVGSNWYRDYCHEKIHIIFLNGRITFKGEPTAYPKDCMLLVWGMSWFAPHVYDPGWLKTPVIWTWSEKKVLNGRGRKEGRLPPAEGAPQGDLRDWGPTPRPHVSGLGRGKGLGQTLRRIASAQKRVRRKR